MHGRSSNKDGGVVIVEYEDGVELNLAVRHLLRDNALESTGAVRPRSGPGSPYRPFPRSAWLCSATPRGSGDAYPRAQRPGRSAAARAPRSHRAHYAHRPCGAVSPEPRPEREPPAAARPARSWQWAEPRTRHSRPPDPSYRRSWCRGVVQRLALVRHLAVAVVADDGAQRTAYPFSKTRVVRTNQQRWPGAGAPDGTNSRGKGSGSSVV